MNNNGTPYPPRGMIRIDACRYLGFSLHLFDALVKAGTLPPPKLVNGKHVWDRVALDVAFAGLPDLEIDNRSQLQRLAASKPATTRLA
jgi:hypothetical protein